VTLRRNQKNCTTVRWCSYDISIHLSQKHWFHFYFKLRTIKIYFIVKRLWNFNSQRM